MSVERFNQLKQRLDAVQAALSCGTGCGSCRIDVARLLVEAPATLAGTA